jgi:hypothetical protein
MRLVLSKSGPLWDGRVQISLLQDLCSQCPPAERVVKFASPFPEDIRHAWKTHALPLRLMYKDMLLRGGVLAC